MEGGPGGDGRAEAAAEAILLSCRLRCLNGDVRSVRGRVDHVLGCAFESFAEVLVLSCDSDRAGVQMAVVSNKAVHELKPTPETSMPRNRPWMGPLSVNGRVS